MTVSTRHWLIFLCIFTVSCSSGKEFAGFSYDPPNVTNTTDKETEKQPKRVIGAGEPRVWVSNEFDGARLNDFFMREDSIYQVKIHPENAPINNSPWYAFKLWSDSAHVAKIALSYEDAQHRYIPKLYAMQDSSWQLSDELRVQPDTAESLWVMKIKLSEKPVIISAQPLYTSDQQEQVLDKRGITGHDFVKVSEAGLSKLGRPIAELEITEVPEDKKAPVLAIVGRQHPPEVTGYLASLYFLEELTSDTELAQTFRETFVVKAFPMINPDGVDMGHWRHNAAGIDLNRDWKNFNQPETRVVRDALQWMKGHEKRQMFYGIDFHSTNENLFYPINEEVETTPDNITQKWIEKIKETHPDIDFTVEPFDTSSPIAKNWFYRTFGIDAVTYEVDDRIGEEKLEELSRSAARLLMELLLKEWEIMEAESHR